MSKRKPLSADGCRQCVECKKSYPVNKANFKPDKRSPDGLTALCRDCARKRYKRYRAQKPDKRWNVPEYQHQRFRQAKQQTECIICGNPATVVDHDHRTGHIRGALCTTCNSGLGFFRDDPALLELAALYVQGKCACGKCETKWGGLQVIDSGT